MSSDGIREIGVGMLGYAFMGKAHSNAFRKIDYMTWPPPLRPRLVVDRRPERGRRSARPRALRLRALDDATGRSSSPTPRSGSSTTSARTRSTPSRRSLAAEAGKHVVCEKPLGRDADESYEIWRRVAATGVKHLCAFNYRFVPAVRLARELIDAGELGEIRHFRGRYLQDWGDTDARGLALRPRRGRLGSARRPRRARRRPRPLPRRRDRRGRRLPAARSSRIARSTTRSRRRSSSRTAPSARSRRRGSRSAAATRSSGRSTGRRARSPSTWSASTSCRSSARATTAHARLHDRARLGGEPSVLGALVAAGPHHRLGRHVRPRAPPLPGGDRRTTRTSRRTARRSRTATARPRSATRSSARARAAAARRSHTGRS